MFKTKKEKREKGREGKSPDRGFLVFHNTSEVIRAETILKKQGWDVRVMGPPPELRTGCDLVIEFPLMEQLNILRVLEEKKVPPIKMVPVDNPLLKPIDLLRTKDYGNYIMVRAANMKLTVEKDTLKIVNISGGGCPDVPYIAEELIGKTLRESPSPKDIGHTLCAYALHMAYDEIKKICLL
ncbi:MAG: hypothetical protein A2Z47_08070 [Thermodesulfovibrio sp. RBG_19FT_COMBO_42_12]|nr:MAG: hypothetical protein A2Z47_08070 [Thermodesulfovibrio sp. RBG_19FT_COMBO_42_12]